jgi:hypothetical protein
VASDVTESVVPEVTGSVVPEVAESVVPEVAESAVPEVAESVVPEVTGSVVPEVAESVVVATVSVVAATASVVVATGSVDAGGSSVVVLESTAGVGSVGSCAAAVGVKAARDSTASDTLSTLRRERSCREDITSWSSVPVVLSLKAPRSLSSLTPFRETACFRATRTVRGHVTQFARKARISPQFANFCEIALCVNRRIGA